MISSCATALVGGLHGFVLAARIASHFQDECAFFFAIALGDGWPSFRRARLFEMVGGILIVGSAHGHDAIGFRFHLGKPYGMRVLGNFVQRVVHLLVVVFANPGQGGLEFVLQPVVFSADEHESLGILDAGFHFFAHDCVRVSYAEFGSEAGIDADGGSILPQGRLVLPSGTQDLT